MVPGFKGREELDGYLSNEFAEGIVIFLLQGDPVHLSWTANRLFRHLEEERRGQKAVDRGDANWE